MYRKLALTSVTINFVLLFTTLCVFVPWILEGYKDLKVEMPMPVLWVITASNFVSQPLGAILSLTICFFGLKAIDKWASQRA